MPGLPCSGILYDIWILKNELSTGPIIGNSDHLALYMLISGFSFASFLEKLLWQYYLFQFLQQMIKELTLMFLTYLEFEILVILQLRNLNQL